VSPKHLVGCSAIAFILLFVIKNPHGAEHIVANIGDFLSARVRGFSSFLDSL
jgi:hypothetical protein